MVPKLGRTEATHEHLLLLQLGLITTLKVCVFVELSISWRDYRRTGLGFIVLVGLVSVLTLSFVLLPELLDRVVLRLFDCLDALDLLVNQHTKNRR